MLWEYANAVTVYLFRDLYGLSTLSPFLAYFSLSYLIEVKGPGDSLQKNQQRWMQYFHEHGIPHQLTRVTWRGN
ncbi:MAG: hypothetical protein GY815_19530 [Gammaproteobacteria bacterium]|nr:hypothetical protein [Gammaproteobacteria bacterium]